MGSGRSRGRGVVRVRETRKRGYRYTTWPPTQSWTPRSRFVKSVKSNRVTSFGRSRVVDVSSRVFNRSCQRRSVRRHRGVAAYTWFVESFVAYVDRTFVCTPFERVRRVFVRGATSIRDV